MANGNEELLENRLKLLENSVLSLNNLWKMSIVMQGPSFADAAIKNLDAVLSDNPNDPVAQSARDDLEKATEVWKEQTGEEGFGLERLENHIEALRAGQLALQFVVLLALLPHGSPAMARIAKALEHPKLRGEGEVSEAFKNSSEQVFSYFKKEIDHAVKMLHQQQEEEVVHA